jgi:hypothetical protein
MWLRNDWHALDRRSFVTDWVTGDRVVSNSDRVIAVGLLTERDLEVLGSGFKRAFPLGYEATDFDSLLAAIDEADRRYRARGKGRES